MKQFDLKEYLENTERKVVTKNGYPVRIICTDRKGLSTKPIVALITIPNGDEVIKSFWENGIETNGTEYENDLFFAPVKHEGWINLYRDHNGDYNVSIINNTEQDAKEGADGDNDYITTIKIEWED